MAKWHGTFVKAKYGSYTEFLTQKQNQALCYRELPPSFTRSHAVRRNLL